MLRVLDPCSQLPLGVDTRSARVALIDGCKADSVAPEPVGVLRKDDVVLDLGYVPKAAICSISVLPAGLRS